MIKTKASVFVAVALLLIGCAAGWWINGHRLGTQLADMRTTHAENLAAQQQASAEVISTTLLRERNLRKTIEEIEAHAETEKKLLNADLTDSNAAARGLRAQLDRISGRISADAATAAECQTATTAAGMLAGMLAESDEAAGIYAEEAARSRSAGLSCEARYDAARAASAN